MTSGLNSGDPNDFMFHVQPQSRSAWRPERCDWTFWPSKCQKPVILKVRERLFDHNLAINIVSRTYFEHQYIYMFQIPPLEKAPWRAESYDFNFLVARMTRLPYSRAQKAFETSYLVAHIAYKANSGHQANYMFQNWPLEKYTRCRNTTIRGFWQPDWPDCRVLEARRCSSGSTWPSI